MGLHEQSKLRVEGMQVSPVRPGEQKKQTQEKCGQKKQGQVGVVLVAPGQAHVMFPAAAGQEDSLAHVLPPPSPFRARQGNG